MAFLGSASPKGLNPNHKPAVNLMSVHLAGELNAWSAQYVPRLAP